MHHNQSRAGADFRIIRTIKVPTCSTSLEEGLDMLNRDKRSVERLKSEFWSFSNENILVNKSNWL